VKRALTGRLWSVSDAVAGQRSALPARSLHLQCMMSDRRLTDRRETPFAVIRTLCIATRDGDDGVRSPVLRASFSLPQAPDLVRSRACTAATLPRTLYALRVLSLDNDSLIERSRLID